MKSIRTIAALAAVLGLGSYAHAGLLGHRLGGCGASKCCDCAPTSQPTCCKPTIVRPCHRNLYNYQRTCAKPMACCDGCAPANSCGPTACATGNGVGNGACVDGNGACAPGAGACAAPCAGNACTDGGNGCLNNNNGCAAPCDPGCAAPCDPGCGAPCDANACCPSKGCGHGGLLKGLFSHKCKLFGHKTGCCETACDECAPVCCDDSCEIAELIYKSQTCCYAKDRARAIHRLGDRYDCVCHPEIMSAFIYALNDADERVRAKAADEIGDQIRRNGCCCSACVVSALTNALADCDRGVRREAEQALRLCGYDIVDGCCDTCDNCDVACNAACGATGVAPAAAPAAPAQAAPEAAPAPAPPTEQPKAYSPKPQHNQLSSRKSLSNLFGMVR